MVYQCHTYIAMRYSYTIYGIYCLLIVFSILEDIQFFAALLEGEKSAMFSLEQGVVCRQYHSLCS